MKQSVDVALILWNRDVIDLVAWVLSQHQLTSRGIEPSEGTERMENFIFSCSPTVVVMDLEPPYHRSGVAAMYLQRRFPEHSFVMTCADSALARKNAPWVSCFPIFQKPYAIDEIGNTLDSMVRRASKNIAMASIGI